MWSTASRPSVTSRGGGQEAHNNHFVQVSRLGQPLVNELVIPRSTKDVFNSLEPTGNAAALALTRRGCLDPATSAAERRIWNDARLTILGEADPARPTFAHLPLAYHMGVDVSTATGPQCAGHVTIHDRAVLSGLNAVHQFVTIGTYAFVGGGSRVNQDIPPYVKAVGNPMELYGLNSIGLQRAGFSGDTIAALKRPYRLFFNSELNLSQALERARSDLPASPEVERFLAFVESSERGVPA